MRYIFGEKLLYSHCPPICQGGVNGYIAIFPGGNLLDSHCSAYTGQGENGYGGKWLYNTGN